MALFALDYDGTYTADKELWDNFIEQARSRGHEVIVATMRYEATESEDVIRDLGEKVDRIIFTGRKAKKQAVRMAYKDPDIWIDDNPDWLYEDAL